MAPDFSHKKLSRICLGHVTDDDIQLLEKQKLPLRDESVNGRMKEVIQILSTLPADTVPPAYQAHV